LSSLAPSRIQAPPDTYLSPEAREICQPIWRLLTIGRDWGLSTSITETDSTSQRDALKERFQLLATTVYDECAHLSSVREVVLHPAYLQIVGMGPRAVPWLLRELEHEPGHWFWALRAITQEDPVIPENRGMIAQMAQDWLRWARGTGLRW
jgi:hypothetical protein